jgi:ATP-binding cassette subfamily B protein IrtA
MENTRKSGIAYLLQLAGKYKLHLVLSAVFGILSALCTFIPYIMVYKTLLLLFGGNTDFTQVLQYGAIAALAIVGKFGFSIISGTFSHSGAFNTLYQVRTQISRHIAKINLGFFTSHTSGEIKKVIIEDVERIEKFLAHQIPDFTSAICVPVIVFVYLLTVNVPMALCLLIPVVLGLVIQFAAMAVTGKQMPTYHRLLGKLNSTIMQFINGMPVMKTYNMTAESYREYAGTVTEYNAFWKQSTRSQGYTYGIFVTLVESGILFALPLGGWFYFQGSLSSDNYLFFMIMSMVFLTSLLNLMNFAMMFNQIMSGLSRIQDIMNIPDAAEGTHTLKKSEKHDVAFKHVTFRYDKAEVLKDINITLPAGTVTAFVGASGAGKTTAAQLIPKFWEVTDGAICIDNENINTLKTENLMDLVSFVFQETFMLNDSIYQNIAIGNKSATREEVEAAAKAAQIHDFIMSLPHGYDTKLGEDGVKMSGGEKQRVCIARAILKDAPIIVFDEATSYTDIENEHKIQIALSNLLKGKTTVMIAHRLHTIVGADQICVFDQGRIAEKGTHTELLEKNGLYSRMWQTYTQEVAS